MKSAVSFATVGAGFRAAAYWRIAARIKNPRCVGAVARSPRAAPVPIFGSLTECLRRAAPDFLITALPRTVHPAIVAEAVEHGVPVLAETPAAADLAGMRGLWAAVGDTGLVQVAEQYLLMPTHAARQAVVRAGLIGEPSQVQVSSTQLYHAVALIRGLLGVGRAPVTVRATRHVAPLVGPLNRAGWTDDPTPHAATTTIATIDFGAGRSGLYDFTDNQTRNQLRSRRLLVRGSHGELQDDQVRRLRETRTIVQTPLIRTGEGDLALGAEIFFRNPWPGSRLNDDEIATARLLTATADWVRGVAPPPYPLVEGLHDDQVGLAIEDAADTGRTVVTSVEPWTSSSAFGAFTDGG